MFVQANGYNLSMPLTDPLRIAYDKVKALIKRICQIRKKQNIEDLKMGI